MKPESFPEENGLGEGRAAGQGDLTAESCQKKRRWIPENLWEDARQLLVLAGPLVRESPQHNHPTTPAHLHP